MKWIRIKDRQNPRADLPLDQPFFAAWKGAFCIAEFNEEEDIFYISYLPAQTTNLMKVSREREGKFTHFCIPEYPED